MSGEDVRVLQQILNKNVDTKVSYSGIGSSGQESTYFGPMTRSAVIRFQEKYRQQILIPNGLSSGSGIVGPSTNGVLSGLFKNQTIISNTSSISTAGTSTYKTSINPNITNIDTFLSSIDRVSKNQGLSTEKTAIIKKQILADAATSTDFQKEFVSILDKNSKAFPESALTKPSMILSVNKFFDFIKQMILPQKAVAGTGVPFGGALLYSYFCSCSGNWLLTLQPLPPTFVTLLVYTPGTQLYLHNNIPFGRYLLGEYTTGAGICESYVGAGCAGVPSEGLINPLVGSSL